MNKLPEQFRNYGNGKMIFEVFPQEYIDLDRELQTEYHPKLAFIAKYSMDDIDIKLAQIAAYCEVMLDGDYRIDDRVKLAGILCKKLQEKREYPGAQVIILP
jgi:hypothetical protein